MTSTPLWERDRHWPLMRPFVYYLVENYIPPAWIQGKRVVDFSAGLADLAPYLASNDPASLTLTVPDEGLPAPADLPNGTAWIDGVLASRLSESLPAESVDLFSARMVFQFPRWEDGGVDVDVMLEQIVPILAPGGRLVITTHAFFPLQRFPSLASERDSDAMLMRLTELAAGAPHDIHEILTTEAQRIAGLTEMVTYLGLPPRLGSDGTTGFGLKIPMLVESFVRSGLILETVEEVEVFTYPLGMWHQFETHGDFVGELGRDVFATKRRHLAEPIDPYKRPSVVRSMLQEVRWRVPIVWVPIVRVVARKAG
ncbi:MAG: hypothetical protein KJO84_07835 [Acidimicrobiia bacterium]|nr:hypothetical protein [Acidimicrobiia bacterium]